MKKFLIAATLSLSLGVAGVSAFAVDSGSTKEAIQTNAAVTNGGQRFNILVHPSSWWKTDNAIIKATYSDSGAITITKDSDLGQYDSTYTNYNKVNIGGTNYYAVSMSVDVSNFTYGNFYFQRCNPSGGAEWNNSGWVLSPASVKNKTSNTVWINSSSGFEQNNNLYKVALHTGLTLGSTSYQLVEASNYDPAAPSAISGYLFKGWYKDSSFTTPYTKSTLTGDINLYAKYEVEPTTGYYMVGDAAFMTEFGTSGDAFDFNSGVLMNGATGGNKAVYSFTTSRTITLKGRYYSHASNWWVSQTEMSESAEDHGVTFDGSGNYVIPAGTYSLYIFVKNNEDASSLTYGIPLDSYCTDFLTNTGAECKGSSTDKAALMSVVGELETLWAQLDSTDQETLSEADANPNGSDVEKVAARYDYILGKYGYGTGTGKFHDFMGRTPSTSAGSKILTVVSSNSVMPLILVVSLIGFTTIGGYFFLRKKKEN